MKPPSWPGLRSTSMAVAAAADGRQVGAGVGGVDECLRGVPLASVGARPVGTRHARRHLPRRRGARRDLTWLRELGDTPWSPDASAHHRIVVRGDRSAPSGDTLRWAAQITTNTRADITVVTCWQYPQSYGLSGGPSDWNRPTRPQVGAAASEPIRDRGLATPRRLAVLIAVVIGANKFAEGLAMGQSVASGEISLATAVVIGLRCTTPPRGSGSSLRWRGCRRVR